MSLVSSDSTRRLTDLFGRSWLALAASVVLVALFTSVLGYSLWQRSGRIAEHESSSKGRVRIARITSTQNCRWDDMGADVGYGSELSAGETIRLSEGLAEITFEDGATMLLESPATVAFKAGGHVEVREGRLSATVPPEARGFYVHTKTLELSNVGAEFGLLARETGASELHVFSGMVEADVLNPTGERRRRIEVRASEAVLASPLTTTVFEFPADESHFVRSMSPVQGPHDGLLAYEGFVYPEGPLSAQNGGFGWAGPWFSIAADDRQGPESNHVGGGSLTVEGFASQGNHFSQIGQQNRIRRSLATSVGGVFDAAGLVENQDGVRLVGRDGNQIYLSFLQRASKIADVFYGVELHRGDGNRNRVLNVGSGVDETGYGATSNFNVYGPRNFPSLGEENTETNFIVLKITFGAGNRDTVEVFRNPESLLEERECTVDVTLTGNFSFDRISLANFNGTKIHEVDELRVGTHFLLSRAAGVENVDNCCVH